VDGVPNTTVIMREAAQLPWPCFRGNAARSGNLPGSSPERLTGVRFDLKVGRISWSSPAIDADVAYIGLEESGAGSSSGATAPGAACSAPRP
jgi:hypothetical protein